MRGSIRKRGINYHYYFYIGSGKDRKQISGVGTPNKAETEVLMRTKMKEYDDTGKIFTPSEATLSEFLDIWFNECCVDQLRHGTRCDYKNAIENHIKTSDLGNMKIKDIGPEQLQNYVDNKSRQLAASTMKAHFVVLNKSFKYAVYPKKYIKENPMLYVEKRTIKKDLDMFIDEFEEVPVLTTDEYRLIEDRLKDTEYWLPIQIAFHTGMRQGEIAGLTWHDIDLKDKTITINKSMFYNTDNKQWELGKTKSGKPRIIDIGDTLVNILKESKKQRLEDSLKYGEHYTLTFFERVEIDNKEHVRVVTTTKKDVDLNPNQFEKSRPVLFVCSKENGEVITNQSIKYSNKIIKRDIKELKDKYHFHILRHTHATMLLESGVNMKDVQERLGHANISITMDVYAHVTPKSRRKTIDLFEKALMDF